MAVVATPDPAEILRPSRAERWGNCSGSHALEPLYPEDQDTPEQREGTAAHFYVTETLYGRVWPVDTLAPNGHPITAEMVECGTLYLDDVLAALADLRREDPEATFYVEAKVYGHKTIHPKNEGTPDTFALSFARRRLIVWDYKYGHRYVPPFRNLQLTDYVGCIFETFGITREQSLEWSVSLRVIQPRNYHREGPVRRWDTSGRIMAGLVDDLAAAARKAKSPTPTTQTGPWCGDCSARRGCDAFMRSSASAMDVAGDTIPHDLPPQAVGLELRHLKRAAKIIEARVDALEEQGLAIIRSGGTIPYFALGHVVGKERWRVPSAEVFALGDAFDMNFRKEPEPVTPAAARKLGLDPEVVAEFAHKPMGAAKMIAADDTAAAKAFGNY